MNYQDYIDLGFKRTDMDDNVEFRQTGYYGYNLEKKINKTTLLVVYSGELDKPRLYIKKKNNLLYHIIVITPEIVKDLVE
jgi:hypothetical protein